MELWNLDSKSEETASYFLTKCFSQRTSRVKLLKSSFEEMNVSLEEIQSVVENNDKKRYELTLETNSAGG